MKLNAQQMELAMEIDEEYSRELLHEENTIEALLYTLGRSVSIEEVKTALDCGEKEARRAMERLCRKYEERNGGMVIRQVDKRYQMCTNPEYFDSLIRVAKAPKKPVLTDIVMETLAIIAYKQPVTKAEIERIRGVSSDHAVNKLVEYGLASEVGRLNAPGRPALFATTEEFLRRFGIASLDELPELAPTIAEEIKQQVNDEVIEVMGTPEKTEEEEELSPLEQAVRDMDETTAHEEGKNKEPESAEDNGEEENKDE